MTYSSPIKDILINHILELEKARIYWKERATAGPTASLAWFLLDSLALYKWISFQIRRSRKYTSPQKCVDELTRRKKIALIALGYIERNQQKEMTTLLQNEDKESLILNNTRLEEALRLGREQYRSHSFIERNIGCILSGSLILAIITRAATVSSSHRQGLLSLKLTDVVVRDAMKTPDLKGQSRFLLRLVTELRNGINTQIAAAGATAQHIYFKHGDAPVSALLEALFQGKKRTAWSERISLKQAELLELQHSLKDQLKVYYSTLAGTDAAGGRSLDELMSLARAGDMSLLQHRFDKGPWISRERVTHAELMVKDLLVTRTHLEVVLDELLLSTSLATDLAAAAPALVSIVLMSGPLFRAIRYGLWVVYQGVSTLASLPSLIIATVDSFSRRTSSATTLLYPSSTRQTFGWLYVPVRTILQWGENTWMSKHSLEKRMNESFCEIRRILAFPVPYSFILSNDGFINSLKNNFEKDIDNMDNRSKDTSINCYASFPSLCDYDIGLLSVTIYSTIQTLSTLYERGEIVYEKKEKLENDLQLLLVPGVSIKDRRLIANEICL
jgi:hypothetical protein